MGEVWGRVGTDGGYIREDANILRVHVFYIFAGQRKGTSTKEDRKVMSV